MVVYKHNLTKMLSNVTVKIEGRVCTASELTTYLEDNGGFKSHGPPSLGLSKELVNFLVY